MSEQKHDGNLAPMDKPKSLNDYTAHVEIFDDHPPTALISISGGYTVGVEEVPIYLDPKQALSLLAWLEQERATLEQLAAKEQEA